MFDIHLKELQRASPDRQIEAIPVYMEMMRKNSHGTFVSGLSTARVPPKLSVRLDSTGCFGLSSPFLLDKTEIPEFSFQGVELTFITLWLYDIFRADFWALGT